MKPTPDSIPLTNRLLAALPRAEYERLRPHLAITHLPRNRVLLEAGDEMRLAYFLNDGIAAVLAITEDGRTVDISTIGSEGMIGIPLILNASTTPCRIVTQLPCSALGVKRESLLEEFYRGESLQKLLLGYVNAQLSQALQSSVCHSLHSIRQRLAHWLLMIADSVASDSFDITQEHIANMLGHQRNRITLAARELSQSGLIEYGAGTLKVLDRNGLEAAACECYRIVKDLYR